MTKLLTILLLASCVEERPPPAPIAATDPRAAGTIDLIRADPGATYYSALGTGHASCAEFTWPTKRGGKPIQCRVLWCKDEGGNNAIGGAAVLWCEDASTDAGAP